MVLLSDTESDLISRLGGVAITFIGVMCAALLGVVLKNMEYGKWLVIGLVCFGQSLMTFAEKFWWLWGKYVLVFSSDFDIRFHTGLDGLRRLLHRFQPCDGGNRARSLRLALREALAPPDGTAQARGRRQPQLLCVCAHFHCYLDMCFGLFIPI